MDLTTLIAEMTAATTTMDSAASFIGGVPKMIADAVAAAIAGGATADQLKPVTDLGVQIQAKSDALLAAIAANTNPPTPSPTPPQKAKAKGK